MHGLHNIVRLCTGALYVLPTSSSVHLALHVRHVVLPLLAHCGTRAELLYPVGQKKELLAK